ncbi:MAG: D-alanine--D-alanine ligase [Oscillospiraceae bacterium]|nr:D-alanine--D-alanine ligase [Oscillospiraceae bacterium]
MKIVVIAGGLSPERDVSLSSGSLIANALIDVGYKVCLIDLYAGVETKNFDEIFFDLKSGKRYSYAVPQHEPDLEQLKKEVDNKGSLIGKNVIELCKNADLAFLALHGDIGENGKLQAVFDVYGILYTGTGYIGSLIAMDKDLAKKLMIQNNILTPEWEIINITQTPAGVAGTPFQKGAVDFPCVIKPCSCGSSVGVSIVKNKEEYIAALEYAKKYEEKILIEKMIEGREFSVGILDNKALPAIEIIPNEDFYDYKHKYQPGITKEVCPAELCDKIACKMQDIALKVHKILRLGSYSRIDFMVDKNNNIYCLEANTLPGMTPTSLLPQEANAAGISYNGLCDKIVKMAGSDYE